VRGLLFLVSAIVFVDMLFFSALTPLLPHYANTLGFGKTGAGVLAAAYPAGTFVGAIPSGIVAARLGVKPTVLIGLATLSVCTLLFGLATEAWQLDGARFVQGVSSSFSWTGALAWLVAANPPERRGAQIGSAFATAVGGSLLGPVVGAIASVAGIRETFGAIGILSLGLVAWAAVTPAEPPEEPQPLSALARAVVDPRMAVAAWMVMLPGLLFGTLTVLAPLRLSELGYGSVAIGAVFVCAGAFELLENIVLGHVTDRAGTLPPLWIGLAASAVVATLLPVPEQAIVLAILVVLACIAFGAFFTPGITLLTQVAERIGLDYGYALAVTNLAWAPGQAIGAVGGAAVANAASDAAAYLTLAGLCVLTLVWLVRARTRISAAV